jgi:hypothetical protein
MNNSFLKKKRKLDNSESIGSIEDINEIYENKSHKKEKSDNNEVITLKDEIQIVVNV